AARVGAFALPCYFADAMPHHFGGFFGREIAAVAEVAAERPLLRLPDPERRHLRDLLFDGHAAEQVRDAAFDGQVRVAIIGLLCAARFQAKARRQRQRERAQESPFASDQQVWGWGFHGHSMLSAMILDRS